MNKKAKALREVAKYDAFIITGASSGIGGGFAEFIIGALKESGARAKIYNISRRPTKFDALENFESIACDLAAAGGPARAAELVKASLRRAEFPRAPKILLVNNSGFGAYGGFPKPSAARNLEMIDLNARALTELCALFLPEIEAGGGSIINIASTAAFQPCPYLGVYAATKAYVKSFTLSLGVELKSKGCKCVCVCPGPTESMFFKAAGFDAAPLPAGFGHKPLDVVLAALAGLNRGRALVVVGFINRMQAFFAGILPEPLVARLSGAVLRVIRNPGRGRKP